MIYFELRIITGLFGDKPYAELAPTMDTYQLAGNTIAEIREKVARVFGSDSSWMDTASIDLNYVAIVGESTIVMKIWSNIVLHDRFRELLLG